MTEAVELKVVFKQLLDAITSPDARVLAGFSLILARIIPFYYMSFFMASRLLPMPVKVFISLSMFMYMIPSVFASASAFDYGAGWFFFLIKEIFIGVILGMLVSIPNYIVMISGMIIDFQRGASSLVTSNMILAVQDSPLGILFTYLLIYVFWANEIPFIYIEAISASYKVFPIDKLLPSEVFSFNGSLYNHLRNLFSLLYDTGIQMAAPSLVILIMIDMFLGITNRLAPQVMISFLAQGLKAMLGISVIVIGWQVVISIFTNQSLNWAKQFYSWILSMPF